MMKYWFLPLVLVTLSFAGNAQINESDTVRFQWRLAMTANYQKGNVDLLTLRGRMDLLYAPTRRWVFKTQNSSLYQSFYNVRADEDLFSRNYLYYQPQKRLYPYLISYISSNYRRKLDQRVFTGAGLTWQMIRTKNHIVKVSTNAVYETNWYSVTQFTDVGFNGSRNIDVWRYTLYVSGWSQWADRRLKLYYDAFLQPQIGDASNNRSQVDIVLDYKVWKDISLSVNYMYVNEQLVPEKNKRDDTILTMGVSWQVRGK